MNCKCNCNENVDQNVIMFVRGTSVNIKFTFNVDVSAYDSAQFTIRKDYQNLPVINKTITDFSEDIIILMLEPEETDLLNDFINGQSFSQYIWGLNLIKDGQITNVFPQTGSPAPICIVQKNVVENQ